MDPSSRTSMAIEWAVPPSARALATVSSAPSGSDRYPTPTARPARARARHVALPIPRDAPVTRAIVASGTGPPSRTAGIHRRAFGHGSRPPYEARPPRHPRAERRRKDEVARLQQAPAPRAVQGDRDGRGRGVPNLLDVDQHLAGIESEALAERRQDARVRLVADGYLQVGGRVPRLLQHLGAGRRHGGDRHL